MASFAPPEADIVNPHTFSPVAPLSAVPTKSPANEVKQSAAQNTHSGAPPTPTVTLSSKEAQALSDALAEITALGAFIPQTSSNAIVDSVPQANTPHVVKTLAAKHPQLTHKQSGVAVAREAAPVKVKLSKKTIIATPIAEQITEAPAPIRIKVKATPVQKELAPEQPIAARHEPARMKIKSTPETPVRMKIEYESMEKESFISSAPVAVAASTTVLVA